MMKRCALLPLLFLALATGGGQVAAQARERPAPLRPAANPGAVIAREIAFARMAQEKGQWTAFAAFAAPDAVMFVPQMVLAKDWLKGRADPPVAVRWQANEVISSCDGTLAVSHGTWQGPSAEPSAGNGWFTTIWQRAGDGTYRWILDHGDTAPAPAPTILPDEPPGSGTPETSAPSSATSDMVTGRVADCPARPVRKPLPTDGNSKRELPESRTAPFDPLARSGRSDDGSLDWAVAVTSSGERRLVISWLKDGTRQVHRTELMKGR